MMQWAATGWPFINVEYVRATRAKEFTLRRTRNLKPNPSSESLNDLDGWYDVSGWTVITTSANAMGCVGLHRGQNPA